MTDDELIDIVMRWAETPKRSVCGKERLPCAEGRYCVDCHAVAYNAREELRRRGYD